MKLPRRLDVSGHTIKIVYKKKMYDRHRVEYFGAWEPARNTIYITYGLPPDRKKEVFLHELLHAIADIKRCNLSETATGDLSLELAAILKRHKIDLTE